jgi:hypothetical protein
MLTTLDPDTSAPPAIAAEHFRPILASLGGSARLLRMQRYRDLRRVRPAIQTAAAQALAQAERLQQPEVGFRRLKIERCASGMLVLAQGSRFHCPAFDRLLAGSIEVVVFVMTMGRAIDREVLALAERGDLLEALMLETAAWAGIEELTRSFRAFLRREAAQRGLFVTRRMGPGYAYNDGRGGRCGWRLDEQRALFDAFGSDQERLPVQLLASSAMLPKMSRSGLFAFTTVDPGASPATDETPGTGHGPLAADQRIEPRRSATQAAMHRSESL